jgi:hypothetical protein
LKDTVSADKKNSTDNITLHLLKQGAQRCLLRDGFSFRQSLSQELHNCFEVLKSGPRAVAHGSCNPLLDAKFDVA